MIRKKTSTFGITLKNTQRHHVFHTRDGVDPSELKNPSTHHPSCQASTGGHRNSPNRKCPRAETTGPDTRQRLLGSSEPLLKEATDFFGKQQKRRVSQNRKATSLRPIPFNIHSSPFSCIQFAEAHRKQRERCEVAPVLNMCLIIQ